MCGIQRYLALDTFKETYELKLFSEYGHCAAPTRDRCAGQSAHALWAYLAGIRVRRAGGQ